MYDTYLPESWFPDYNEETYYEQWNVITVDGHNIEEILEAFKAAKTVKGKPTAIVAKTVKGKGVSFMENQASWHGKAPSEEQYNLAVAELTAYKNSLGGNN